MKKDEFSELPVGEYDNMDGGEMIEIPAAEEPQPEQVSADELKGLVPSPPLKKVNES